MSINFVASVGGPAKQPDQTNPIKPTMQIRQELDAVGQGLSSGDLAKTQKALATFQSGLNKNQQSELFPLTRETPPKDPLRAFRQALTSGDIFAARTAFVKLSQTFERVVVAGHDDHTAAVETPHASVLSSASNATFINTTA